MMYLTQQVRKQARLNHVSPPLQECLSEGYTWISLCSSSSPGPPIVSEERLTCLSLISPANTSQYSGSRVRALIQILQHQMDQQELVKEFMVCECVCADVYSMLAQCLKLPGHLPNYYRHLKLVSHLFFSSCCIINYLEKQKYK